MAEATDDKKVDDGGIDTLPKDEKDETEEIIKEIEKENNAAPADAPKKPEEKKPDDKPPKEDKKPEKPVAEGDKKPDETKKPDEEKSRKMKFVPAWVLKAAEDKHQQEMDKLRADLDKAQKAPAPENKGDESKDQAQLDAELRKKTDAIAKKFGTDPDEEYERAAAARDSVKVPKVEIPKEITDSVNQVKKFADDAQIAEEERLFNDDFEKKVLPLVKAEYGDDVPQATIDDIKEKVKDKAYSDEFAKVPLTMLYKGEDGFRELIPKKATGAERSRGGQTAAEDALKREDGLDISGKTELTEAQVLALKPEEFDKYSDGRAAFERSKK